MLDINRFREINTLYSHKKIYESLISIASSKIGLPYISKKKSIKEGLPQYDCIGFVRDVFESRHLFILPPFGLFNLKDMMAIGIKNQVLEECYTIDTLKSRNFGVFFTQKKEFFHTGFFYNSDEEKTHTVIKIHNANPRLGVIKGLISQKLLDEYFNNGYKFYIS